MSHEPDDLDKLLGSLAKEARLLPDPDPEEHPGSGTLYAYYEGKLKPAEKEEVEEHLSACSRCRDLMVEYGQFLEDGPEDESGSEDVGRVADFGAAAEWHRLRERLRAEEGTRRDDASYEAGTGRSFFRSLKGAYSIAAVLAVGVVGLSVYAANLRWEMNQPDPTPQFSEAPRPTRSNDPSEKVVEVSGQGAGHIYFDLPFRDEGAAYKYRLEIYLEGERIYGPGEITKSEPDFFTVSWLSTGLKSGRYEFRVYREGSSKPVGSYFFKVMKR